MTESIYGKYKETLPLVLDRIVGTVERFNEKYREQNGEGIYEHFIYRVKAEDSMREKCRRKGLPETPESALTEIHDAVACRIVCRFVDDIFKIAAFLKEQKGIEVIEEKDYVHHPKPNGYRSYHMIIRMETPWEDIRGNKNGKYDVEIQLRTIAMDSWAALEHQVKYKKNLGSTDAELITEELKRCADELASCDLSMQTIRNLINEGD